VASVSTYLNFNDGQTEEAFTFYKNVFGTEFVGNGIMRMGDVPGSSENPELREADRNLVMHVSLPILAGHILMGSDVAEHWGKTTMGTNVYISLHPDTREEADRLFAALSEGGEVESAMADQFWGDYWGATKDKFGVQWMVNVSAQQ
jgi:PhnB protein